MVVPVLALFLATAPAPACPAQGGPRVPPPDATLRALYEAGATFDAFLAAAEARKQLWHENWGRAEVPPDLLARARAVPGSWRLLAVAFDGCSDSVSTIPFIAKLVAEVDGLDLRIIDSVKGKALMDAHRTPDGRPATPTLILIDDAWEEAGCWIERPSALQTWYLENQKTLGSRELVAQKMAWYKDDAGATTVREVVEMIEAAARGARVCAANAGG